MLIIKGLIGGLSQVVLFGALFLIPAGITLWLQSVAALVALVPVLALFLVRIWVEERMLRKTLAGYEKYTTRVKYRLVPFVW